jgi:hypothetical protein
LLLATFAVTGCKVIPSANPADYVGEYVLIPADGSQFQYADLLILKPDQSTVGIRYSRATGQVLKNKGSWRLDTTNGEHIDIGEYSYPVEMADSDIHLAINDDMHVYYEKVQ